MSEALYLAGDPATFSEAFDDVYEVDCGNDCGWTGEVPVSKEYRHNTVYIWGEYVCPNCNEKSSVDVDYDADEEHDY